MRDQPPSIQDGAFGFEPDALTGFAADDIDPGDELDSETAKRLARAAFESSTTWLASARRGKWADSLRAFNSVHPQGSKYNSREFQGRSSLYRPQTRTMVRHGEASTAAAFFSNEDVISVHADNDDDPMQQASAEILKALVQYRLTKTIKWFSTLIGARQDAEVMGICVAKVYWKYEERHLGTRKRPKLDDIHGGPIFDDDGQAITEDVDHFEITNDIPCLDLISPENIRYDAGSDWRDPITTSPYVIELIPMYFQDVEAKMESGEWFDLPASTLRSRNDYDQTRVARENGRIPGQDADAPTPYDTVWIHANIIKYAGQDWYFLSLGGSGELLTDPVLLSTVHLHGQRPYVVGTVNLETHRNYPTSKVEMVRDLQRGANDALNLRFDAVKMALHPRQFVAAGAGVELNDLRTMIPGKVVVVKAPKGEPPSSVVSWDRPPEPGQSSYMEQQLNQLDWDSLSGSFSNQSAQASQLGQQSATGMHLLSGVADGVTEYELRIFAESFVEPVINLLIKLEQAYETDEVILATAAQKAGLFQRFGHDKVTDDLLQGSVTSRVNVGIGATNPAMKLRAFQQAAQVIETMFGNPIAAQGLNFHEVLKEIMAGAGYRDGERFITPGFSPAEAMQQMEQSKAQAKGKAGGDNGQARIQAVQIQAQSSMQEAQLKAQMEREKLAQELQRTQMQQEAENFRAEQDRQHQARMAGVTAHEDTIAQIMPVLQSMGQLTAGQQRHLDALHASTAANNQALGVMHQQAGTALQQHQAGLQALTQHLSQQAAAQQHNHAQVMAGHAAIAQHLQHLAAPKRVVRGPDGKVVGVEAVQPTSQF